MMLESVDTVKGTKDSMSLQNLGFRCSNKKLFAQPMVQAHYLTMWHDGDRALAGSYQEEVRRLACKQTQQRGIPCGLNVT